MSETPSRMGSTFAERRAAREGKPMPKHLPEREAQSTFAQRMGRPASQKAVQSAENKAMTSSDDKAEAEVDEKAKPAAKSSK